MKVAVTGAGGFIGSALVRDLGNVAYPITRTDADFTRAFDLRETLRGCEAIIHTAGRAHRPADTDFRVVNTDATIELARQAAESGVRRFVFLSSIGVICNPEKPYAVTKRDAEIGLEQIASESKLKTVVIRPPLVYGPGARGNWARLLWLVRSGLPLPFASIDNRRSLIGIDNLVSVLRTCLEHPAARGGTFAVADADSISTPELIRRIAAALDRPTRLFPVPVSLLRLGGRLTGRADEIERLVGSLQVDIRKTCETLDWQPPISVDEGIRRAVAADS